MFEVRRVPKRKGERVMKAAGDRPTRVWIPDSLWRDRTLPHNAKLLWAFLRIAQRTRKEYRFAELREAIGVCQNSLLAYLKALKEAGWLLATPVNRYTISFNAVWRRKGPAIVLPSDILFDVRIPEPAKWVWGLIDRRKKPYTYGYLEAVTGYCRESLVKYLGVLREHGWIENGKTRVNRRVQFPAGTYNPKAIQRKRDLEELNRGIALAATRKGYSVGQFLMARMVHFLVPHILPVENAEMMGLCNRETGGQMRLDLYLSEYKVALEFHGPQHDRTTELYPSGALLEAQQRRDRIKEEWCRAHGIHLVPVRAGDLSLERLAEVLAPRVPVNLDKSGRWHIFDWLEETAARYRKKAAS